MKNIKSFVLGMATIGVFLPIAESITEVICSALEPIKATNTKKVLKANKEIQDLQIELDGYHDECSAIGFQVDSDYTDDDDDEDWEDEEWEDKAVIGFR